jgi:uncharacterized protein
MKKIFGISLWSMAVMLFCLPLWAKAGTAKNDNSLLWKISKEGVAQPSYLFGTIHVICEQDYFWSAAMQKSFDQTSQLCVEMDISNNALSMETAALMMDFTGGTLRDYFSNEADYQLVKKYIEDSLGQSMEIVERMKPVALYMIYSIGLVKGPCKETVSYELKLAEKAKQKSNKIVGLETVAEQMEVMESIPTDSIISQMLRISKGEKSDETETNELVAAYKKQDLNLLNKMIIKSTSESGMDGAVMIDNRNKKWMNPMVKMMNEKSTFFAVGAGHVYGLLQLLRNAGYKVEAVK